MDRKMDNAMVMSEHSTARDAFVLMSTLLVPSVPREYLDLCGKILQERHVRDVFEERSVQQRCGWALCRETLSNRRQQKYRVSVSKKQVYNAREEQQFCSDKCHEDARKYIATLPVKAPQMLPSITHVFGTAKPNPKDYDGTNARPVAAKAPIGSASRKSAQPKVVWAKQPGMGVVEKNDPTKMTPIVPKDVKIVEHSTPAQTSTDFSTANAVLIEGYVFPSHKAKKATKAARQLAKAQREVNPPDDGVAIVSDEEYTSDDSSDLSSESDMDDESSEDSEGNSDVYSAADLSPFATVWWKVSEMVTPATLQLVARLHGQALPPLEAPLVGNTDQDNRRLLFGSFCHRQLQQVAKATGLSTERGIQLEMNDLIQSFQLMRPLEGTQTREWNTMCLLLLMVANRLTPATWRNHVTSDVLTKLCGIDMHEMQQLLEIFCASDSMTTIVLADEMDSVPAAAPAVSPTSSTASTNGVQCRKCRRKKCRCGTSKQVDETSDFSDAELASMMQDALKIKQMAEFGTVD
ncbi:hypothetical protein AeMF1_020385 [Aphanomyces euteiches]|nr:hypothetical protein AeMF1_020385 [Aphanomyces euteiches]